MSGQGAAIQMQSMGLTRQMHGLLSFMNERIRETGIAPSFDEMRAALDLKSKSGVHRLVTSLEERGFILRLGKRARAIEILRLPENLAERCRPAVTRRQTPGQRSPVSRSDAVLVPLVGRIAAGTPIEALQNKIADVTVSSAMLGRGQHYALEVTGDFMINAGILDGDTVIIQETDAAMSGEIVVALVDNEEATLKRLRRRGDCILLEPANPVYENRLYSPGRVAIQGRLIGLVRGY